MTQHPFIKRDVFSSEEKAQEAGERFLAHCKNRFTTGHVHEPVLVIEPSADGKGFLAGIRSKDEVLYLDSSGLPEGEHTHLDCPEADMSSFEEHWIKNQDGRTLLSWYEYR
jgi:hypothetical protein